MVKGSTLEDEVAAEIRKTLLPQRFPSRRDVEIEAGIRPSEAHVSFYDYFWLESDVVAASAVRLHGNGLQSALSASAARQLIRALTIRLNDPESVLVAFADLSGLTADAVLLRLNLSSAEASAATAGYAAARLVSGAHLARQRLLPGSVVWLSAGELEELGDRPTSGDGIRSQVEATLSASEAGAGVGLLFKSSAKSPRSVTYAVPNVVSEIPPLIADVEKFFARLNLSERATAGLDVALDELLTNAVHYGFRDANPHEMLVTLDATSDRLLIEIKDDGAPFDPLSIPTPDLSAGIEERQIGGLGMHFVRTLLDSVHYDRRNGWNVLTLEKRLTAGEDDRS